MAVAKKKIVLVAGARPNFMKIAPLWRVIQALPEEFYPFFVHTGQHYDATMSSFFLRDLGLPMPHFHLGTGSGSHANQTAKVMVKFEGIIKKIIPELVLVVGDVNSTIACALVCAKERIPLGHVEAGLRSRDRSMPEEINRLITDALSDYLFTPSVDANENLKAEGVSLRKIFLVGNIMIDSLVESSAKVKSSEIIRRLGLTGKRFVLLTLHRPSNVDGIEALRSIWEAIEAISKNASVVFPVHPRTRERMMSFKIKPGPEIILTDPLSYFDFLRLEKEASLVLTDSGGVQEETTYLGIPCLTLRENTERPITITLGTNELVGINPKKILAGARKVLRGESKFGERPPFWDGKTAQRIVKVLRNYL